MMIRNLVENNVLFFWCVNPDKLKRIYGILIGGGLGSYFQPFLKKGNVMDFNNFLLDVAGAAWFACVMIGLFVLFT